METLYLPLPCETSHSVQEQTKQRREQEATIYLTVLKRLGTRGPAALQQEMWANAQRDGRLAEHRWRPLFNAAKFG